MSSIPPPAIRRLGDLGAGGYAHRTLRDELRSNLQRCMSQGKPLFDGIVGYQDSVIPALENALLCGHDIIFLGERGQAKTRMIRSIIGLLDEWVPEVAGSEIHDDQFDPISAFAREQVAKHGDDTTISWLHRDRGAGHDRAPKCCGASRRSRCRGLDPAVHRRRVDYI